MLDRRFLDISLIVNGIVNEPDAIPTTGTQYIVGPMPRGVFENAAQNSIARYDGSDWSFISPRTGKFETEVLNASTGEILQFNGSAWKVISSLSIPPVLDIVSTGSTKPDNPNAGDKFINTTDNCLYIFYDDGTSSRGELQNGDRYASSTDKKIYTSNGTYLTAKALYNGAGFLNKADHSYYVYDSFSNDFIKITSSSSGNTSASLITENHTLTASEATAKSFSLANSIVTGQENNTLLFISGLAQIADIDFTASGNSISWNGKALENIKPVAGDVFIIQYYYEA